jgi:hypothetical protein
MAALYASEEKKNLGEKIIDFIRTTINADSPQKQSGFQDMGDSNVTLFKDVGGEWNWLLVVSNNRLDREKEILTSDGHKHFVGLIDSGRYKEMFGHDMPELWVWHVPVAIGDAKAVHYDEERGYLFAGGHGRKGEFYDRVFTALADKEKSEPGSLAASHGMPDKYIARDPVNQAYLNEYASKEFTVLPREEAANQGTWLPAVIVKESDMDGMPDHKRDWFIETFGEDTFNEFNQFLDTVAREADDAGIPKKEIENMADSTEELKGEDLEETSETSEEVTDAPVEETVTDPDIKQESEEEEPEEEEEEEEEKEFVTKKEMVELITEISNTMKEVNAAVVGFTERFDQLEVEVKQLKESDESKIADKSVTTPPLSLAAIFKSESSAIGKDATRLDYNKDRQLHQAGPEETKGIEAGGLGIKTIDDLIKNQRESRSFSFPGQPNGQS